MRVFQLMLTRLVNITYIIILEISKKKPAFSPENSDHIQKT